MRIALGLDHHGLVLKEVVLGHLNGRGAEVVVFGPESGAAEYPVFAEGAGRAVAGGECGGAVLICGTGAGMSIAANKIRGVRAVCCSESHTARLAKEHNNANAICFGARVVGPDVALGIIDAWLDAEFHGGRHANRVNLIHEIEKR